MKHTMKSRAVILEKNAALGMGVGWISLMVFTAIGISLYSVFSKADNLDISLDNKDAAIYLLMISVAAGVLCLLACSAASYWAKLKALRMKQTEDE